MGQVTVNVAGVMTAPRYESVYARTAITKALQEVGIPLTISGGVFYRQCMERMFEDLLEKDVQYALTVDFDSIFTAGHVRRLLAIINQRDEIDAVTAIQPRRGDGSALGTAGEEKKTIEWDGLPIPARTAHFGLTVLDVQKLRTCPKPWFCPKPDEDGRWGDGRTDDDVHFWRQWEQAGNTIYIDPGCRLGHLEEMVTTFNDQMELEHWYPHEWEADCAATVDS